MYIPSKVSQSTGTTMSTINYVYGKQDEMLEHSVNAIDSRFVIQAWPWTGLDQQEEEEDDAAEEGKA